MTALDATPDRIVLPPTFTPVDNPLRLSYLRWRAARGEFNDDVNPGLICPACGGVHVETRLTCQIELLVRS